MLRFIRKVIDLRLPIFVCCFHDQMLKDVNASGCNKLVNIDFHSDISTKPPILNEGTWVNSVSWRAVGHYDWRHPCEPGWRNYCHHDNPNPFEGCDWRHITHKRGLGLYWPSIKSVGVCLSPDWTQRRPALYTVMEWLDMPKWWLTETCYNPYVAESFYLTNQESMV